MPIPKQISFFIIYRVVYVPLLKKPFHHRQFEQHLAHPSLDVIKNLAFKMSYNPFNRPTASQLSKLISWRVKCSSLQLPTLDLLRRNYPGVLKNLRLCFFCNETDESNIHFWTCDSTLSLLRPIFADYAIKLKELLLIHAERVEAHWSDSIRFCEIFSWTRDPTFQLTDSHPILALLLNYIPRKILAPFKAAIKSKNLIGRILLEFVYKLQQDIYNIWKIRCDKFSDCKSSNQITTKSFSRYRRSEHIDEQVFDPSPSRC